MDLTTVLDHLAQARRHVSQGERHLVRQREIIARIERVGGDSCEARKLFDQFESLQRLHVQDCERLEIEAAKLQRRR